MTIHVWDNGVKQYRTFTVVPYDINFKVNCKEPLHQFGTIDRYCFCGRFSRGEK